MQWHRAQIARAIQVTGASPVFAHKSCQGLRTPAGADQHGWPRKSLEKRLGPPRQPAIR